jgi:hypothetical protein
VRRSFFNEDLLAHEEELLGNAKGNNINGFTQLGIHSHNDVEEPYRTTERFLWQRLKVPVIDKDSSSVLYLSCSTLTNVLSMSSGEVLRNKDSVV